MNAVEGVVCIAAIIGLWGIVDSICATVRFWIGERPCRWSGGPPPRPE